jgi:hypothetical protein
MLSVSSSGVNRCISHLSPVAGQVRVSARTCVQKPATCIKGQRSLLNRREYSTARARDTLWGEGPCLHGVPEPAQCRGCAK